MKNIILFIVLLTAFSCNTNYGYIDTGKAKPFDGNMYEYLHSDSYNWDSTLLLVKRAKLEDLFEGKRPGFEKITWFAPTQLSIIRYMIESNYVSINDIPEEECAELLLKYLVVGEYLTEDIPRGAGVLGKYPGDGGIILDCYLGNEIWLYTHREPYLNVPEAGAVVLNMYNSKNEIPVASTNITLKNGVIHSLYYSYYFQ